MGLDNFDILEELGQGAFGTVYKVKRKEDQLIYAMKRVYVKRLTDKEKENTLNEIRILSSIQSPFIVSYKEAFYDEKSESICIILEYADGGDIASMIKTKQQEGTKFTEEFIWKTTYQILRGLRKLHQGKIFHRDIKPANVLFSKGLAKLSDMNISKFVEQGAAVTQIGTPYYRCPEVWNDEVFTQKGDIWSLGCVVYEMVMLDVPFKAKMIEGLFVKITNGVYPPPVCSDSLSKLIKKCLQLNPKKRPTIAQIFKIPQLHRFEQQHRKNNSLKIQMKDVIQIPQDMTSMNDLLPEPNYQPLQKSLKAMTSPMKQLNKKRTDSIKKSSSKSKLNKSLTKSTKTIKIQSFKFIDIDELQSKVPKEGIKSTKKIKSMKRII